MMVSHPDMNTWVQLDEYEKMYDIYSTSFNEETMQQMSNAQDVKLYAKQAFDAAEAEFTRKYKEGKKIVKAARQKLEKIPNTPEMPANASQEEKREITRKHEQEVRKSSGEVIAASRALVSMRDAFNLIVNAVAAKINQILEKLANLARNVKDTVLHPLEAANRFAAWLRELLVPLCERFSNSRKLE
eukprot:TRINITY_DN33448_c0_g1_i1.p1 TRINITY_DN33448_c0_g1~~TRINITY_DN33448_c0_g1_i1.p1  ORF type:complete len:187 (+),score=25.41 TRINITY_DN33448_c0_g1_i1:50-610(+)